MTSCEQLIGILAFSGAYDHTLRVWDVENGGPPLHVHPLPAAVVTRMLVVRWHSDAGAGGITGAGAGSPLALSAPCTHVLVTACTDGALRLYNCTTGAIISEYPGAHDESVLCIEPCVGTRRFITGCEDGSCAVWSLVDARGGTGDTFARPHRELWQHWLCIGAHTVGRYLTTQWRVVCSWSCAAVRVCLCVYVRGNSALRHWRVAGEAACPEWAQSMGQCGVSGPLPRPDVVDGGPATVGLHWWLGLHVVSVG